MTVNFNPLTDPNFYIFFLMAFCVAERIFVLLRFIFDQYDIKSIFWKDLMIPFYFTITSVCKQYKDSFSNRINKNGK